MSLPKVRYCVCALLLVLAVASVSAADVGQLLARIPGEANALVVIDVEKLMNSPLAKKEGWKQKLADAFENKPVVVLPGTKRVAMASFVDSVSGDSNWEVSVMELDTPPDIKAIAKAEQGYVDTVGEKTAAWSPINAYFVQLEPNIMGVVCPANRQLASRWTRQKQTLGGEFVSAYLRHAATAVDKGTEVLMAMDLEEVTSAPKILRRLREESFDSLQGKDIKLAPLAKMLASIKGLTLHIEVGEDITAKGVIDFGEDTRILGDLAKPLLLEMLGKYGMGLPDFDDWKVVTASNQVTASGKLTSEGFRNLLSVVNPPVPAQYVASAEAQAKPADKDPAKPADKDTAKKPAGKESEKPAGSKADVAKVSQKYYQTVAKILDNLEKNIGKGVKSASLSDSAKWLQRDARRIDRLPILNVDPELAAWGAEVSVRMREVSNVFDVGVMQTRAGLNAIQGNYRDTYVTHGYSGDGALGGNYDDSAEQSAKADADKRAKDAEMRQASQQQKAQSYQAAEQIIQGLRGTRAQMRAKLTERYGIDF